MKKKILFISSLDISNERTKFDGVTKKIILQISTLKEMGFLVDYIYKEDNKTFLLCTEQEQSIFITEANNTFHNRMKTIYNILPDKLQNKRYDYIYVRYEHISSKMVSFFSLEKQKKTQIIAELPTYMGKWEPGISFSGKVKFIGKLMINYLMTKNIDLMATFSEHKRIYGIPTVCIENFVDVPSLPIKKLTAPKNSIHLLGVAIMTPSHGFDRVIMGLVDYYKNDPIQKVYFHIVGDGATKKDLELLVNKYRLNDYVIFEGIKKEKELNNIFDSCQIGVASLAIFRKRCQKASELKIREYISRGLPFIYSAYEPFISNQEFAKKVPHNNTHINIEDVLIFYKNIYKNDFRNTMREFAEINCICKPQMEAVFQRI